jgi:hypothetical protein
VEAVVEGGLSRNAAAKRFEVSIASAVRWVRRSETAGEISPAPRRSPLRPHRGPSRLSSGPDPPHAGHHAAGNKGAPYRQLRRAFLLIMNQNATGKSQRFSLLGDRSRPLLRHGDNCRPGLNGECPDKQLILPYDE